MTALRLRYQTLEFGNEDLHVRSLRDNQQFLDTDDVAKKLGISSAVWPLFGVIWASGQVLAHHMSQYNVAGKRILEVGCGIGLASLILNRRLADITATDYHPEAGSFLEENVRLNQGKPVPFVRTGWADPDSGLGAFDLIIGSDLLYEREQVALLSTFIDRHARPECEVVLVDPGRGHHARFSKTMVGLGYDHRQQAAVDTIYLDAPYKGQILTYSRVAIDSAA